MTHIQTNFTAESMNTGAKKTVTPVKAEVKKVSPKKEKPVVETPVVETVVVETPVVEAPVVVEETPAE